MSGPATFRRRTQKPTMKPRRSKYGAVPVVVDGIRFASKAEARRFGELKLLEQAGEIRGLRVHPSYPLTKAGRLLGHYVADFEYALPVPASWNGGVVVVVEDVKSPPTRTRLYRWKIKHLLAEHGIAVREVRA